MVMSDSSGRFDSARIRMKGTTIELLRVVPDTVYTRWQNGDKSFTANYSLTEMKGSFVVEWTLRFHLGWYPWEKLAGMFYDKQLGPVMENSLLRLQKELDNTAN